MWGGGGASAAGGGGSDMSGFASQGWVDENYLSKSFFSTLFIIHATQTVTVTDPNGDPVGEPVVTSIVLAPNQLPGTSIAENTPSQGYTTTTVIALESIEATTNFYSDGGVSALGLSSGGGGGGATALTDLVDVAISNPTGGQALVYDATLNKWKNATVQGGGGGTVTSITAGTGLSGGTITGSGTIAINNTYQTYISHGETAYGWGNHAQAGYLTSSDLDGYATHSWVGQQVFLTSINSSMVTTALGFTPLSNGTTFWGSSVNNGVVNGSITMQNGTGQGIWMKDYDGTARRVLSMDGGDPSALYLGLDMPGYHTTNIYGNTIAFVVGSTVVAAEITTGGRFHIKQGAQGLRIGDALLTWDATNKVLNLTSVTTGQVAHFVASGGVTALQTS